MFGFKRKNVKPSTSSASADLSTSAEKALIAILVRPAGEVRVRVSNANRYAGEEAALLAWAGIADPADVTIAIRGSEIEPVIAAAAEKGRQVVIVTNEFNRIVEGASLRFAAARRERAQSLVEELNAEIAELTGDAPVLYSNIESEDNANRNDPMSDLRVAGYAVTRNATISVSAKVDAIGRRECDYDFGPEFYSNHLKPGQLRVRKTADVLPHAGRPLRWTNGVLHVDDVRVPVPAEYLPSFLEAVSHITTA